MPHGRTIAANGVGNHRPGSIADLYKIRPHRQSPGGFSLGILSRLGPGSRDPPSKKAWRKYFEARVAVTAEWYGISKEEVLGLVACKMREGYTGDGVFDAVKQQLESRKTRILERA